ncbi:glycosyl transferase family protein [Neobacillus bataviensis LMG 21833]|uniref:Glycosyl transferase family protein n=1 Tax=Neobacillus bataviensis LMG 21833 TaxID=1117379 RepID=K6DFL1_9BACI|nr:glycosyltransferase family 2 protein [Neobacillus bataviensis]EKN71342.1 glycosyl transferase family protein [Neobacillus bataviensis LMG 21833]
MTIKDKVASIMVTYNPEADVVDNATSIIQSCERLVIIDNGSSPNSKAFLHDIENEEKITIIYNPQNMGLGHALNQGINCLLESPEPPHFDWIATFDQDSKVDKDYFSKMLASYEAHLNKEEVAILAPNWIEEKLINKVSSQIDKTQLQEQKTVITSGSLVKKKIFTEIGLFEEDYFIDFLDHEFCLRVRTRGYKIFISPQVYMVHNLGNTQQHRLLGSNVMATNHNYIRRYYITRNRLYTYKKYFRTEKEWIKGDFIATAKEFIIILLFEQDRGKKLGSMFKGVFDALLGKKGPMN